MLVSLEQTKSALNIDFGDKDEDIILMIGAASQAVIQYLKSGADGFLDDDGYPILEDVPDNVKWATIALVGYFFRNPDGDPDKAFERGYLPPPVTALLYPLRDPAFA